MWTARNLVRDMFTTPEKSISNANGQVEVFTLNSSILSNINEKESGSTYRFELSEKSTITHEF